MGYIVEKHIMSGFEFHPMNKIEKWIEVGDFISKESAKTKCLSESNNIKGVYRVRSIWDGKISFSITTT